MASNDKIEVAQADVVSAKHKRATPLKPAIWMTGVLVWATVIGLFLRVPDWGGIFLCALTAISFLLYVGSYVFLLAADREALRTERYALKGSPTKLRESQAPSQLESSENRTLPTGVTTPVPVTRRLGHSKVSATEVRHQSEPMQDQG